MTDRWQHAATRLRRLEPPSDLWPRISEGPSMAPLPPPRRTRVVAAVTALGVFAAVGVLLWIAFTPGRTAVDTLSGPNVVAVPPRGEVSPVFLDDGRPVFVVHHEDGTVSVVDAFSSHRAWGFEELNVWCSSTREFVELFHETRFDEYGDWAGVGPAPTGLQTFAFEPVELDADGDPATIRIGEIRPGSPEGVGPEGSDPDRPELCPGDEGTIVRHTISEAAVFDTPAAAVEAAPHGWIAIRGTLHIARDGFVRLCGEIDGDRCIDGAIVRGIDGIRLMLEISQNPRMTGYSVPHVWIAQVREGVLDDLGGDLRVEG